MGPRNLTSIRALRIRPPMRRPAINTPNQTYTLYLSILVPLRSAHHFSPKEILPYTQVPCDTMRYGTMHSEVVSHNAVRRTQFYPPRRRVQEPGAHTFLQNVMDILPPPKTIQHPKAAARPVKFRPRWHYRPRGAVQETNESKSSLQTSPDRYAFGHHIKGRPRGRRPHHHKVSVGSAKLGKLQDYR